MKINVHPLTNDPTEAWRHLSKEQKVIKLHLPNLKGPIPADKVRFVCMSDTHSLTSHIKFSIPPGDVFLHAGDFTRSGSYDEVVGFNTWIGKLPHKHKLVIAGNHELSFDPSFCWQPTANQGRTLLGYPTSPSPSHGGPSLLSNCTYLQDCAITVYGLKIYGTPWQPEFCSWAFNLPRGEACLEKWDLIPEDTDIVLSHSPPLGHGDFAATGVRAGCIELLATVQNRVRPRYHVFGHIHEGYGVTTDGKTVFVNAATCDLNYRPTNPPVVFDVPLPPGQTKN